MVCTFFGHRDTPSDIEETLRAVLVDLIENKSADTFFVGNQGAFDAMVRRQLKQLKKIYPHIRYEVVLAYLPIQQADNTFDFSDTLYPDGLERTPPRYAIAARNKWMVDKADCVVSYITCLVGGAAKFTSLATKRGKTVINLAS